MEPRTAIIECEERLRNAMLRSDVSELDALIADDLMFVGPFGETASKEDDLAVHQAGRIEFSQLEIEERLVRIIGPVAVVLVRANLSLRFDGQVVSGRYRYTRVWRQEDDRWQITAGHVSAVTATS